ncbi:hypothetical protein [Methylophaga sp.]|uniref:hypothetical protein n=1 Tax=Methylophaga sp. TaxID=2024840 RepID=UPI003A9213D1
MKLYPEMTAEDMTNCSILMDTILKQNHRLRASFSHNLTWLDMQVENGTSHTGNPLSFRYIVSVLSSELEEYDLITAKDNPIEAVDEVLKKAGITTVQQYIDLKTLTESLNQGAAQ